MGQHQLAGWGKRAVATIIDGVLATLVIIVVMGLFTVLFGGFGSLFGGDGGGLGAALGLLIAILPALILATLYQPYMMNRTNGQTLGKKMVGIRVIRTNGQQTDFGWSAVRQVVVIGLLFGVVAQFMVYIPTLLNYLWPLWDEENRALHDMLVGSRVVDA